MSQTTEQPSKAESGDSSRSSNCSGDAKRTLIKAVQAKGRFWDAMAASDAIEAARRPDDKALQSRASRSVSIADHAAMMASDIVELIHAHWPVDQ